MWAGDGRGSGKRNAMTVAEFIASSLVARGVTDAFGMPGGVVLDLLYAFDAIDGMTPHLSYHEQSAGFSACGYAQVSGRMGVAYATRGPGFTNLLTPMADAFYDSLPVMFLTAHAASCPPDGMRVLNDQEMDTCAIARNVTKFAARVDTVDGFVEVFNHACNTALSARKGPVFLDISKVVLADEIDERFDRTFKSSNGDGSDISSCVQYVATEIQKSKRPVILVGDGIDRLVAGTALRGFAERAGIAFLTSRFSHDLLAGSSRYYGYVGSHGMREANFILSKSDLVVAIGNRLNFPTQSESFSSLASNTKFIRCEIDESEFLRQIPNCRDIAVDANLLIGAFNERMVSFTGFNEWLMVCDRLKMELSRLDVNDAVLKIRGFLDSVSVDTIVVSDVGNCEFWLSRASALPGVNHRTLYSKSFGALGCGLGKAIGTCYATGSPVACVIGDQGLMVNIQDLQYIARHRLPITIVVIDNHSSGMIRDVESRRFGRLLHVNSETGFSVPDWEKVFRSFGIGNFLILDVPQDLSLTPNLPYGKAIQDMSPSIVPEKFAHLNQL